MTHRGDTHLARTMSKSNEWGTPPECIRLVKRVLGQIELDPASSERSNQIVGASRYYDLAQDGLTQPWNATTVFLNPPYGRGESNRSNQDIWSSRLIAEYEAGNVEQAILLINSCTGTDCFQRLLSHNYLVCLVRGRIRFIGSGKSEKGPTHDNAFVYFGSCSEMFCEVFSSIGGVVRLACDTKGTSLWEEGVASHDDTH